MSLLAAVVAGIVNNLVGLLLHNLAHQYDIYFFAGDPRAPLVGNLVGSLNWLKDILPTWL
jgi:hypothetical protein